MATTRRDDLIRALPYARRYARALTGSQPRGDLLVAESLRELISTPVDQLNARHGLYDWITRRFNLGLVDPGEVEGGLTAQQRQLLLLTALEELSVEDAAPIVAMDVAEASVQLGEARERLRAAAATDVLIIEDEPIIAMDIEELVMGCGHRVVGVASTEADAVKIAQRTRPGLILADINLGIGGDGTSAVSRILRHHYAPVIFVTAYPERLLTGETVEPAFVITKPFEPLTLAIATYQAVTGGVNLK
jgi:CheY-like chemotaxis protein